MFTGLGREVQMMSTPTAERQEPMGAEAGSDQFDGDHPAEVIDATELIGKLDNEVNRCLLSVMSFDWYTVQELTEICDTPLSTTYRKLNVLEEAGFLEQRIRVNTNGKHPEEYRCKPIVVKFRLGGSNGLEMSVNTVTESESQMAG